MHLSEAQPDPWNHLRWRSLHQQLMTKNHKLLLQSSPSQMLVGFFTTSLISIWIVTKYEHQNKTFTDLFTTVTYKNTKFRSHFFNIIFLCLGISLRQCNVAWKKGQMLQFFWEWQREREREDVNGSFHRQEKLLQLGNKYLEKLNLIFVYVKTPGVTVELNCFRPTNRFDFAY